MPSNAHATSAAIAAGWYADPAGSGGWRWWDGVNWTEHVHAPQSTALATSTPQQAIQQEPARHLHVVQTPVVGLEPVPPLDAPLFARRPTAGVQPSVKETFIEVVRAHRLIAAGLGGLASLLVVFAVATGVFGLLKLALAVVIGGCAVAWQQAVSVVWTHLFRQRGLVQVDASDYGLRWAQMETDLPVLATGRESRVMHCARGELGGLSAMCGEFQLIDGAGSGRRVRLVPGGLAVGRGHPAMTGLANAGRHLHRRRDEQRENYLFAAFEIPPAAAARHRGVSVRERAWTMRSGGQIKGDDVEFESIAVNEKLQIRAVRGADEVATRELFGPQLIAQLGETPVSWDQRGRFLLVYQCVPMERAQRFDSFCRGAAAVARAYWADQR